jgi:hypothetical protein
MKYECVEMKCLQMQIPRFMASCSADVDVDKNHIMRAAAAAAFVCAHCAGFIRMFIRHIRLLLPAIESSQSIT